MSELVVIGVVLAGVVAFVDWRRGLLLSVLAGFAQDPVRKLLPGEPVWLVLVVGVLFAATVLGAATRGMPLSLRPVTRAHPALRAPLALFLAVVAAQIVATAVRTGSPALTGIGIIAYLSPVVALVLAFHLARSGALVMRVLRLYVLGVTVMLAAVYLDVAGLDGALLDPVGPGLYVYPESGGAVRLPSGLFRAPEVAAWHGASALGLLAVLVLVPAWRHGGAAAVVVALVLLGAIALTGRRKMLVDLVVFVVVFAALLAHFRRGAGRLAGGLALLAVAAGVGQIVVDPGPEGHAWEPYLERTANVVDDAAARVRGVLVDGVLATLRHNGPLGAGAGVGSQGAQHFGGGVVAVGVAAEGGIAKIAAELGLPGLVAFGWLALAGAGSVWRGLGAPSTRADRARSVTAMGLAAFLVANLVTYAAAAQVYGDPFVLLLLGLATGVLLACVRAPEASVSPLPAGTAADSRPGGR
ncbi:MAG: hypothetical protein H6983_13640 [Ectothiorhodospiraceae bacterium]|nr:hypothetical protein [Ectothiorhodospiraceae bacterium]